MNKIGILAALVVAAGLSVPAPAQRYYSSHGGRYSHSSRSYHRGGYYGYHRYNHWGGSSIYIEGGYPYYYPTYYYPTYYYPSYYYPSDYYYTEPDYYYTPPAYYYPDDYYDGGGITFGFDLGGVWGWGGHHGGHHGYRSGGYRYGGHSGFGGHRGRR